jgi:hypothetical protein
MLDTIAFHKCSKYFAGPFLDRMFFVLVDAHSKWPEIVEMKTTTSTKTIEVLRSIFSRNGIPAQIMSDNGSQFSSDEFATFMKRNDIQSTVLLTSRCRYPFPATKHSFELTPSSLLRLGDFHVTDLRSVCEV